MSLYGDSHIIVARWALMPGFIGTYRTSKIVSLTGSHTSTSTWKTIYSKTSKTVDFVYLLGSGHSYKITVDGNEISVSSSASAVDILPVPIRSISEIKIEVKAQPLVANISYRLKILEYAQ